MRIHDTLTRKTVELKPRDAGKISMYVCGVTPYAPAHIGHARTAVVYDLLRRYLQHRGYAVTYVSNFTDVDDKIIRKAQEQHVAPLDLSARYIQEYKEDMAFLNVLPPDVEPRVSESIPDIIALIQQILQNGYGYVSSDGVYFAVRRFSRYGCLSGRSVDEMRSGARVEINEAKQDPLDFALWKFAKPGEISWDSPWGPGRPGWHIECSAMSLRYLGPDFDIHGGGEDLIFPHHENEIAQSEAALKGGRFVRYWMHSGLVNMGTQKMSKSLGNVVSLQDLLRQYPGQVIRLYLLQTSYEKPLKFSYTGLGQAFGNYERMVEFVRFVRNAAPAAGTTASQEIQTACASFLQDFDAALEDNLNASRALASVFETMTTIRRIASGRQLTEGEKSSVEQTFGTVLGVLGLDQMDAYVDHKYALLQEKRQVLAELAGELGDGGGQQEPADVLLGRIIALRQQDRASGAYEAADRIRDRLGKIGIVLEDGVDGVRYRIHGERQRKAE